MLHLANIYKRVKQLPKTMKLKANSLTSTVLMLIINS